MTTSLELQHFAVLEVLYFHFEASILIKISTNNPCHLTLYYTDKEPVRHATSLIKRGVSLPWGAYFCFVAWNSVEQQEAGDTLIHTFEVPDWSYCQTKWFTFRGTVAEALSPSVTALLKHHHPGETIPTLFESYNIGDDWYFAIYGHHVGAQTFTPSTSHRITSVKLLLYRDDAVNPPRPIKVSINNTDEDGHPTPSVLCYGSTPAETLPTGPPYEWREITLGDGFFLTAGTKYAIWISCPLSTVGNLIGWRSDKTDPAYPFGNLEFSIDDGATWQYSPQDFMFEEWGLPF